MKRPAVASLLSDELWPRDAEHRFRLYGRKGDSLTVLAAGPTTASVGAAIGQLHEDAKEAGGEFGVNGQVGILDAVAGEWIVLPWNRPYA